MVSFELHHTLCNTSEDGTFVVEVYNKKLKRYIEKIIDRNANVLIDSNYTSIRYMNNVYEVSVQDNDGKRLTGLIDKNQCQQVKDIGKIKRSRIY